MSEASGRSQMRDDEGVEDVVSRRRAGWEARRFTALDHRNGHHSGRDRACWRCTVRAWIGRTPAPVPPSEEAPRG